MTTTYATVEEHLSDLRSALFTSVAFIIIALVISLCFHKTFIELLLKPLSNVSPEKTPLIFLSPFDGIQAVVTLSIWSSLLFSAPFWGSILLKFLLPALHPGEKSLIKPILTGASIFGATGLIFAYFISIPTATTYLWSFNDRLGNNFWSFSSYFDYTITLMLCTALLFECAFILFLLIHFQILTQNQLKTGRKGFILFAFTLSALLTPPDVLSQIVSAGALVVCYEFGIFYSKFFWKKTPTDVSKIQ